MNIYQFIQKKFPEDRILAIFRITWKGVVMTKDTATRFLTGTLGGLIEAFTILPGARLVVTDKHYFYCLGNTFKRIVYGTILFGAIAFSYFSYLNLGLKIAFYAFIGFSFIFFTLAYFWIRRMERNYWPRKNLRFVDRDKKIIGIFAPDSQRLGYAGPYSAELIPFYLRALIFRYLFKINIPGIDIPGIVRFKIKENFEEFERLIKEDFEKYDIGEKDITRFSGISLALIIIFTFLFFLIFFYIYIRYF